METFFWISKMIFVRFILSVFILCTLFLIGAAAPLFDQAPVVYDDTTIKQGVSDPESQRNLRESASFLKERFNLPDYCKCTSKYLQSLALGEISSSNPTFNPNVETCKKDYFSCLKKCPAPQAMVSMGGERARMSSNLICSLINVISRKIRNSHHHKSGNSATRSLAFLPPSYAIAGQHYTPPPKKLKKPRKPKTKEKSGQLAQQSTPSNSWPPRNHEEEALKTCGYESKCIGPDLASYFRICLEGPTIGMDSPDPSTENRDRQGLASNKMPPKPNSASDGLSFLAEIVDDGAQHNPGSNSRIVRRSLPYMNPPYAQSAGEAQPGEKGDKGERGTRVGTAAQKGEGLSVGVLLFFFGCSMTPLLVLVWVGRMYREGKYQRVSRE